jgi:hypothetical protein
MWNPQVSGSGNAKLSTAFDVIRRFILLFAWDMPEFEFIGTAVSKRFHRCAIVRASFACRVHPETWIGQSDDTDEYSSTPGYDEYSRV